MAVAPAAATVAAPVAGSAAATAAEERAAVEKAAAEKVAAAEKADAERAAAPAKASRPLALLLAEGDAEGDAEAAEEPRALSPEWRGRGGAPMRIAVGGKSPLDDESVDLDDPGDLGDSGAWYGSASESELTPTKAVAAPVAADAPAASSASSASYARSAAVAGAHASSSVVAPSSSVVVAPSARSSAGPPTRSSAAPGSPLGTVPKRSSPLRPSTAAPTTEPMPKPAAPARPVTAEPKYNTGPATASSNSAGSSLLLARAKAAGGLGGVNLLSVEDLFGSDEDEDAHNHEESFDDHLESVLQSAPQPAGMKPSALAAVPSIASSSVLEAAGAAAGGRGEPAAVAAAAERAIPQTSAPRENAAAPREYRSSFANQRDEDASLHWPPTDMDYKVDAALADAALATDAELRARRTTQRLAAVSPESEPRTSSRQRHRGFAPDAKLLFELEAERQLTDLVLLLAMDAYRGS